MSDDDTPTMQRIEDMYSWAVHWDAAPELKDKPHMIELAQTLRAEFRRALAKHDRQVAERAWEKGAIAGHRAAVLPEPLAPNPYQAIVEAATGPTPGGLPGLTDVEAEAFLAAIDKSTPVSANSDNEGAS